MRFVSTSAYEVIKMSVKASILLLSTAAVFAAPAFAASFTTAAAPLGVTYQPIGRAQGYGAQRMDARPTPRPEVAYSNENGLTLYTFDKDEAGKSNCTGDCATTWLPAVPVARAKEIPGWTIISHPSGVKQWAHNGKPLYRHKDDKEGGDVIGLGYDTEGGGYGGANGRGLNAKLPDGWKVHKLTTGAKNAAGIASPFGFEVREVTDAAAAVLVDDRSAVLQKVLYAYNGDITNDKRVCDKAATECPNFVPVQAPELARASAADWSVINRKDGIRQWSYKGKPLYTYEGDRITGDVHGAAADKRWQLAVVFDYFRPENVSYSDGSEGMVLTTNKGMTLYRRDLNAFNPAHTRVAHDYPYRPRVGRMIRDVACNAVCQKSWKPHLAPANAQPSGYWGVHVLPDGKKQWTYKDYALYTYVGDKAPGDQFGNLTYDITMGDDPTVDNDAGFPALYKPGFNWGVARF